MNITTRISDGVNPREVQTMQQHDPFQNMAAVAKANGQSVARVRGNFGDTVECLDPTGRKHWVKFDVSIEVDCPQTAEFITHAQQTILRYAIYYSNSALRRVIPDYATVPEG
jgi:hypothetical protein